MVRNNETARLDVTGAFGPGAAGKGTRLTGTSSAAHRDMSHEALHHSRSRVPRLTL